MGAIARLEAKIGYLRRQEDYYATLLRDATHNLKTLDDPDMDEKREEVDAYISSIRGKLDEIQRRLKMLLSRPN